MHSETTNPPRWYWVACGLALLWNLVGLLAFIDQATLDPQSLSATDRTLYEQTPSWAMGAFAVAVIGGVVGCIALLLRRAWALPLLLASVIGLVVQFSQAIFATDSLELYGAQVLILPIFTFTVGIGLIALAVTAKRRTWIR